MGEILGRFLFLLLLGGWRLDEFWRLFLVGKRCHRFLLLILEYFLIDFYDIWIFPFRYRWC